MQIGKVIHKYRKARNLTQEEMAKLLGVTAPAVNKWERGVNQPDIALLAPIARLLGITLETLLCFQEVPTAEEISGIIKHMDQTLETASYEDAFQYAADIIHKYPNCHLLIWQLALLLDVRNLMGGKDARAEKYQQQIVQWYAQALESDDAEVRKHAADSLFHYYVRKERYAEAEQFLCYFPSESIERKQMQAEIYSKTDRRAEAYKAYEEILFSEYQKLSVVLHHLYLLSLEDRQIEDAKMWIDKASGFATLFDMGLYHSESCKLELAAMEKDTALTLSIVKNLLDYLQQICVFTDSPMYAHMHFKTVEKSFYAKQRQHLLAAFRDKEAFAYMDGTPMWDELINKNET